MHRCFVADLPAAGESLTLSAREAEHLFRTLRGRTGEPVLLCNGRGLTAEAVINADRTLSVRSVRLLPPPERSVHLYVAPPKTGRIDDLLRPLAEIGVRAITPLPCRRSVVRTDGSSERWKMLLTEGCKQSGNPYLPEILPPAKPEAALAAARAAGETVFYGDPAAPFGVSPEALKGSGDLAWFVGPEGGFAPEETDLFRRSGAIALRVAPYVLRIETAALGGSLYLLTELGKAAGGAR